MTAETVMAAAVALMAGAAGGALYFGALRQSVNAFLATGRVRPLVGASLLRLTVTMAGLAALTWASESPVAVAAALLGFVAARVVLVRHRR